MWAAYISAAERMILVYAAFATLVLLALAVWTLPIGEHRSLSNVLVLGPLTLARPWVVVAGGLWPLALSDDWCVRIAIVLACAAQLGVGLVLDRIQARTQRRLISRLCLPEGHLDADR